MPKNNKQDFYEINKMNYGMISLLSSKTRIGVIGAGKAGILKAKHFLSEGFTVYMINDIDIKDKEKLQFIHTNKNLIFNVQSYNKDFLVDKHIIIICINDSNTREIIINDCEELSKIYINCSDYKDGNAITSAQLSFNSMVVGINTKYANPKGAVFIADKIKNNISEYDEFIEYTSQIRNRVKYQEIKNEVLNFIINEDFYFFFKKKKVNLIL